MKKWFCIVLAMVSIAFLGWLGWKALCSPEPTYQGRRLSEWLDDYNNASNQVQTEPASEAVRAIGTNSLPFLLANIKHSDSPFAQKFFKLVGKQHSVKLPFYGADRYRSASILALRALGSNATPLCPELLKVSEATNTYWWGSTALLAIGPTAIPTLAKVCRSTNESVRTQAGLMIAMLRLMPFPPFGLSWNKAPVNGRPIFVIGYPIGYDVVREMLKLLEDPDAAVRRASADAIGHYIRPPYDQTAVEALVKALNDTDAEVRLAAGRTLHVIDPIVATRWGVK